LIFIIINKLFKKRKIMTKDQVFGIIRHGLTFVGGILVIKGYTDDAMVQEVIGGVLALAGSVWSIVSKKSV